MSFCWLIIAILMVWRVTHLLYAEDGPWDMFVRLRRVAGETFWGTLLDCFYCLSLWIALPIAFWIGDPWKERLLLWPAVSGGAILLEKLTAKEEPAPVFLHADRQEEADNVLRQQANSNEDGGREQWSATH